MGKREQDRLARKLSAELGVPSAQQRFMGLLLGAAICGALIGSAMWLKLGGGPAVRVYGRVDGFHFQETDEGSFPYARVWVDDRQALVSLPRSNECVRGARIALYRRKAPLGYRYRAGMRPCEA